MRYIVGIDEVGRGPLAGPVSVGIVVCRKHFVIDGTTDSKVMTKKARARAALRAQRLKEEGVIDYGVFSMSSGAVDEWGIERAIAGAIARGLKKLVPNPEDADVVLDGRLRAPEVYRQQTIIHGDALVPAISLAAIIAKVARDKHMDRQAALFPGYGFEMHKGYGTEAHIEALRLLGPSPIHRMSFLSGILSATIPA